MHVSGTTLNFLYKSVSQHARIGRSDIMDNDTLIVFAHELCVHLLFPIARYSEPRPYSGNLAVELDSVTHCNVRQEHSYLVGPGT